ncbi:MAG: FAD:protein FMN transferase [Candidatus Marinimicrobia bacterium]|nr:FAD:protein FMN transferase [Candidatus Neomarinimicrobiota bacterium]
MSLLIKNIRLLLLIIQVCLLFIFSSCSSNTQQYNEFAFNGSTMGTTYHITIVADSINVEQRSRIATSVDSLLRVFNKRVSTYDDQSEISHFNQNLTIEPVGVSNELLHIVKMGQDFCNATSGAFDITVMPLVNFFGFGYEIGENRFPTVEEIDDWLQLTGCDKLLLGDSTITKTDPRISIDLSALAKGDASDHVAVFLKEMGFENLFVEIGGEIMTHGFNKYGRAWKIGIDRPNYGGAPGADLQHIIELSGLAVASSGDYRNYREIEGKRISHTIDPRSGSPIAHNLAAVTIVAESCMIADAIATSVMVLGPEDGLTWLKNYSGAEGLLIFREPDGTYREIMTDGFRGYLAD